MAHTARTQYERTVLHDARTTFANPFRTPIAALAHLAQRGAIRVAHTSDRDSTKLSRSRALAAPLHEAQAMALAAATGGIVALSEVTARTLNGASVCRAFRREGCRVRSIRSIASLDLWEADEVASRLRVRYMGIGALGGALAAQLGATSLTLDVPLLAAIALRQIQDYAMHYGFDIRSDEERTFAIRVLIASVVPGVRVEDATFDDLGRVGQSLARAWKRRSRKSWFLPFAIQVAGRFLRSSSRGKTLKRIVSVGTAAANAWFLSGVAEIAQAAYRRRFVARSEHRARLARLAPHAPTQELAPRLPRD